MDDKFVKDPTIHTIVNATGDMLKVRLDEYNKPDGNYSDTTEPPNITDISEINKINQ